MTVKHNRDRGAPSNVSVDGPLVSRYVERPQPGECDWIDYGVQVIKRPAVERLSSEGAFGLAVLWHDLIERRQLTAMPVEEDFYEVGTPERLESTTTHLKARGILPSLLAVADRGRA